MLFQRLGRYSYMPLVIAVYPSLRPHTSKYVPCTKATFMDVSPMVNHRTAHRAYHRHIRTGIPTFFIARSFANKHPGKRTLPKSLRWDRPVCANGGYSDVKSWTQSRFATARANASQPSGIRTWSKKIYSDAMDAIVLFLSPRHQSSYPSCYVSRR